MTKIQTDVLTLEGAEGGWTRVYDDDDNHVEYVYEVLIAGNEFELTYISDSAEIECTDWSIQRDHFPALLIEAASWYDR